MASNGKKKTTVAKMNRENKVREKRAEKKARKDQRKRDGGLSAVMETQAELEPHELAESDEVRITRPDREVEGLLTEHAAALRSA